MDFFNFINVLNLLLLYLTCVNKLYNAIKIKKPPYESSIKIYRT